MNWLNLYSRLLKSLPIVVWTSLSLNLMMLQALAGDYPTGVGGQTGTQGGTRLGPCPSIDPSLTALVVPSEVSQGIISQDHRTFWFYVPYKPGNIKSAKFRLIDQAETEIYRSKVLLTTSGIISITVPSTVKFKDGELYAIDLTVDVYCTPSSMPAKDRVLSWVQMRSLNDSLRQKINQAKLPQQKAMLYEQNGYWYDALTLLANVKRISPNDKQWERMLRYVKLEKISSQPVVECCNSK